MKKKRILKPKFDTGTNDKPYLYYGTPEQLANPDTIWEYPEAKDGAVITPKGNYADTQQYIAATHGSAFDQKAALPLIQFLDPTGITNYPEAYQEIKNFYNNPSRNSAAGAILGILSALPLAGKYGKLFKPAKYLNIPGLIASKYINKGFRKVLNFMNDVSWQNKTPQFIKKLNNISNITHNSLIFGSRVYENGLDVIPENQRKKLMYYYATNSGGEPSPYYLWSGKYNGSYIYNGKGTDNKSKYVDERMGDRDLVNLYINRQNGNIQKINNSDQYILDGNIIPYDQYVGYILPTTQTGVYKLNKKYKPILDHYINDNLTFSANQSKMPEHRDLPIQQLDQVKHFRIKPKRDKFGNYTIQPSKIWDFAGTTTIFGDRFERAAKEFGGGPFILKQKDIPIEFIDGYSPENYIFEHTVDYNMGKNSTVKNLKLRK